MRFTRQGRWKTIVEQHSVTGDEWFAKLEMEPIDLAAHLRAVHGDHVADIFNRIPAETSYTHLLKF
jgi:hypothetical protein